VSKQHEHSAWAKINRRLGPTVLNDGERERPYYVGEIIDLRGRIKSSPDANTNRKPDPTDHEDKR